MRYFLIAVIICYTYSIAAQSDDVQTNWIQSSKVKIDLFNLFDEYPAALFGFEYPLKNNQTAIEHELGLIFSAGNNFGEIERSTGFKTSHTYLMYSKNRKYAIGAGLHFRELIVQGQIETCGSRNNSQFGGCDFFRLYEDPIKIHRWAGYLRLRRQRQFGQKVMFSVGADIGAFYRKVRNDEYQEGNLSLTNRWFRQDLNDGSGLYFRVSAQFIYRL